MGLFSRKKTSAEAPAPAPPAPSPPAPPDALRRLVDGLRVPCVSLTLGPGGPARATSSYVAGHPYTPDDRPWPSYAGLPMSFLCQIDFAEVPPLDGFPTRGLLQWFVGSDDTIGLTFDETAGTVGFAVRWYDDPAAPSLHAPTAPTPWHLAEQGGEQLSAPLEITEATALVLTAGQMLPAYDDLPAGTDTTALLAWAQAVGEAPEDLELVWEEHVRGPSGPWPELGGRSNIGGSAGFTQLDPRGTDAYPAASSPGGRLLVELDSAQFGGWGDAGIGHLFGDPAALAAGDLSGLRYHWDCG